MSQNRDMDRKKVLLRNKSPSLSLLMKRYRSCKEGQKHLTAALSRAKKSSCQVGSVYPLYCRHNLCLDCQRRHANQATEQQRAQAELEQRITFHRINIVAMTREIGEVCWPIFSKKELIRLEENKELIRPMNITRNGNYRS